MVKSLPAKKADSTPSTTPDDEQPEWVTPDMLTYVDEVFRMITVREADGKRTDSTKVVCRRLNFPEDQEAIWSAALPPRVWAFWVRDQLMLRFAYRIPEVWGTAYRCSVGQGTNEEIRGLGHLLAYAKRHDIGYVTTKHQHTVEVTLADQLRDMRKRKVIDVDCDVRDVG